PISSRTLMRMTYRLLEWPTPQDMAFPNRDDDEGEFQSEIGIFLKNSEPGFRGFDFQARLAWEERMGRCTNPGSDPDFIEKIVTQASTAQGKKVRDVVVALKDRLINDPTIDSNDEQPALEAILGVSLDADASQLNADSLRVVCGALLSTPQYLLHGIAPKDATEVPVLTPAGSTYADLCSSLSTQGLSEGLVITCGAKATVSKP
ncbi:MAG: hypothetical protein U0165_09005, partial [Polyangiaceae bacterium]